MTYAEIKIDVICERTGDPKPLVSNVIALMKKIEIHHGVGPAFIDRHIPARDVDRVRTSLKKDADLITWYKQGLRYNALLGRRGDDH